MKQSSHLSLAESICHSSELLSLEQVADLMQISPEVVCELIQSGELVAEGEAGNYAVRPSELADYLDRVEVPAATDST